MSKFAVTAILILAFAVLASAQYIEVGGAYVPESEYYKKNGDKVEGASTTYQDFNVSLAMPFMFDIDTVHHKMSIWMVGLNYAKVDLHLDNVPIDYPEENMAAMFTVMNMRAFSERWFMMAMVGGGVQSEYSHTNEHTVVGMGMVNFYRTFKYVDLGVGIMATNMMSAFLILPLPVLALHIGERVVFTMDQFGGYRLNFKYTKYFELAIVSMSSGAMSLITRRNDEGEKKTKVFAYNQEVFGVEPTVRLGNSMFYVSMLAGIAYQRTFRIYNKSFIVMLRESLMRDAAESDVEPYISAKLSFRLMPEE